MIYDLIHTDTCLPDYFSGDWRPWFVVPIYGPMTLKEIKEYLLSELNQGAIGGNLDWEVQESDQFYKAAKAAINRLSNANGYRGKHFKDLDNDYSEPVRAYFVLVERG